MSQDDERRDRFELWLMDMDDALERFMDQVPEVREKLDYSAESLDVLEKWLLERYPTFEAIIADSEKDMLDGMARYVGETFRKNLGGIWDIVLDDPKNVWYRLPIVTGFPGQGAPLSPVTMTTAAADRRTGTYWRTILQNLDKRAQSAAH
jgi:hypothetical protein